MNKFILFALIACVAVVACNPVEEVAAPENIKAEAAPIDVEAKPNHEPSLHHDVKHHHDEKNGGDHKKAHRGHHHHEGSHLVTPQEKTRLLEVFGNLTKEQKDACDKKNWKDEHKNHTEEEKAAWRKLNETEKKGKMMDKWNAKSEEDQACTVHKMEEFAKKRGGHHAKGGHSGELVSSDEKKRLLEVFANLTKENQDACDKKSWRDEHKNQTEEDRAAWRKLNETERKDKKEAEFNTKSDEERACTIHRIEEMKKKTMGGKRGDGNTKRGEGIKKQRGEQEIKKSGNEKSRPTRRGNDKNGNNGQNSRRSGSDKMNANGNRRGQQKVQDQA